jgi:hypothetical protein
MARPLSAVLISLSIAALVSAPGLRAQQRPTFSAKTTLLTLDVAALDKDGKPVPGLVASDFEIKINGTVQPVQAVAYVEAPHAPSAAPNPALAAAVTNRRTTANVAPPAESRVFLIFIDDLSFEAGDGKALFVSAEAFVARLQPSDYVGYGSATGVGAVNPTLDRRPVLAALKHAVGNRVVTSPEEGDYVVGFSLPASPGSYSLRLAIADADGHVGSVVMPLSVALTPLGSLDSSDLLTWVSDSAGRMQLLAVEDLPASARSLTAMIELYPQASTPGRVTVRFAVLSADGRSLTEKDATVTTGMDMLRADAPVDVAALPSGSYAIKGTVSVDGRVVGSLTTSFTKHQ